MADLGISSFKDLLLQHLAPGAGVIVALTMFSSPIFAVLNVMKQQHLGDLNPLPSLLGMFNCAGWVGYSLTNGDLYVFFANGPGFLIGSFLVLGTYPYASKKQQKTMMTLFLALSALLLSVAIGGIKALESSELDIRGLQTLWGLAANFILVLYYGAPLSTVYAVLKTRNSASIYIPLSVCAMLNSTLWVAYGLAVNDYFIAVPNAVGWVFALIQIVLRVIIPPQPDRERP